MGEHTKIHGAEPATVVIGRLIAHKGLRSVGRKCAQIAYSIKSNPGKIRNYVLAGLTAVAIFGIGFGAVWFVVSVAMNDDGIGDCAAPTYPYPNVEGC